MIVGQSPLTEVDLASLSQQAGDVLAVVAADGRVTWWSDDIHPVGLPLSGALVPDDARLLGALLSDHATGPQWLRLRDAQGQGCWVAALATPCAEGWVVQFRDMRGLSPVFVMPHQNGVLTDREQLLHEVAWLLTATPRSGTETAVVTCELTQLPEVTRTHGRLASEEVVEVVMGRISDSLRSGDRVARLDAARVLMVLRGVRDLRDSVEVLARVQDVMSEPIALPDGDVLEPLAAGITLVSWGESADSVLSRSAEALELALQAGPGRVITSPPM